MNSCISLQIDSGIRSVLVQSVGAGETPKVAAIAEFPVNELSRDVLGSISGRFNAKGSPWVLLLGRGEYQFSRVDKPSVADAELEQSLRWLVPFKEVDPQDAAISWIPVPRAPGKGEQVYVAACDQSMVNARAAAFHAGKLELAAVDIRETSQRNIASLVFGGKTICLLSVEASGVQVTITRGKDLYLERFIRESLSESDRSDVQIKRVGIEVRRSLEFVRNTYPDLSAPEIFVCPMESELNFPSRLSSELGLPVSMLDLRRAFDWPAGSALDDLKTQARFLPLLGACLRL